MILPLCPDPYLEEYSLRMPGSYISMLSQCWAFLRQWQLGLQWWYHLPAEKGRYDLLRMCGPFPIHVQRQSFWKLSAGAALLSVPLPVLSGHVYAVRTKNSYLGGTDPFVLTSRDAPATLCCAFNGLGVELGAAPGRSLVSLTEGWGYKGLPWNTHIPELRQRLSGSYPLEGQFVGEKKKVFVKTWIGRQILFSPQNYVLFAVIPTSTFCAQFVAWDSDGLMAFSRSTGDSQLFNSGQDN